MSRLSFRARSLEPNVILSVLRAAAETQKSGRTVISLAMGEPGFGTPPIAQRMVVGATEDPPSWRTAMDASSLLREAVAARLKATLGLDYELSQIAVTAGVTQVLFNALLALVNEGDEVILIAPYLPAYFAAVRVADGVPLMARSQIANNFELPLKEIRSFISERTKCIILNSPANPSGAVYSHDELEEFARIVRPFDRTVVISDNIYDSLVFDGCAYPNLCQVAPDLKDRTILLSEFTKSPDMTEGRIGYMAGPTDLVEAATQIAAVSPFSANTAVQVAALAANRTEADPISTLDSLQARRDYVLQQLRHIPGLACVVPKGGIYAFVDCSGLLASKGCKRRAISNDVDFALYLVKEHGVAIAPGSAFGYSDFFRISFAASNEILAEALRRLKAAAEELSR